MSTSLTRRNLRHTDRFIHRHLGPTPDAVDEMLRAIGHASLDEMVAATVPASIRSTRPLDLGDERSEFELLNELREMMAYNEVYRSFIGMGYHNTITPPVIVRNILENPGWYTAYTPYQAEIAQGRLQALLNFQTMVIDLTGLPIANASLLDEATAAAEAMHMSYAARGKDAANAYFVSEECLPQTVDVLKTRAEPLGIEIIVGNHRTFDFSTSVFGVLLQYPSGFGTIYDYRTFIEQAHAAGAIATVSADLLSLTMLTPPGEFGADVAIGSTQRFGVPLGYGGPHAAYIATLDAYKRQMPGRIIGVSIDADGNPALRMALQTREQHIRREKATSNICTAQVLLAVVASMYAVYHGPRGLRAIAERIHSLTAILATGIRRIGHVVNNGLFFDTLHISLRGDVRADAIVERADEMGINLRVIDDATIGISLDETTTAGDVVDLLQVLGWEDVSDDDVDSLASSTSIGYAAPFARTSGYLSHPVFNSYHSETEMLRYMRRLEEKDIALNFSMIPLGSCTMKLNATSEMIPVTWPEVGAIHPFAPIAQTEGYQMLFRQLEDALAEITRFSRVSLQPNAGSQGEYTGLLVIRAYHSSRGEAHRNVCLIPRSAHGTNPASAVMAGMRVVVVETDSEGNIDMHHLKAMAAEHSRNLAALMITYPSTHGVFEESIREVCTTIHEHGGQVYMDGANMNAQVGLTSPGEIGADVCHLNLHKTFCIPHGGGGPGVGPIGVAEHLAPFLPGHSVIETGGALGIGAVAAAPYGSSSILPISWVYIFLLGGEGLTEATRIAILNANYMANRLEGHYPVLYKGKNGMVAHECILDVRHLKATSGVEVEDIAKRLIDYGFHAPTVSFPVAGTLMIEPTESESKEELDRFCDALIAIREEIREIEVGIADRENNVLKNAPHTAAVLTADNWDRPYTREKAAYPAPWLRSRKYWPSVGRVNNAAGDRHLVCACPPVEEYALM